MKKKIIVITSILLILIFIGGGIFYYFNKQDSKTTLTIIEKQWIEDNKNTMQDFAVVNSLPIFNYDGEGLIYNFLEKLETTTGLEFNKMSYSYGKDKPSDYAFMIVDKKQKNDILIYQDNYALITKTNIKYNDLSKIKNMKIGVLEGDLKNSDYYIGTDNSNSFVSYETMDELLEEFEKEKTTLTSIVLPKTIYMEEIVSNNYNISYNITEMTKDFVIRLGKNKKLNEIIKKYYKKWFNEEYTNSFRNYYSNNYFIFNKVDNDSQVNFKSKKYVYGFVNDQPYDMFVNQKLVGINNEIIKQFVSVSGIEISYVKYKSKDKLIAAFNSNEVDFFFNDTSIDKYKMDVSKTISIFDEKIVVLVNNNSDSVVNSIRSLRKSKISTLVDSQIAKYLRENGIDTKNYNTVGELLDNSDKNDIVVTSLASYDIYKNKLLKNYSVEYIFDLESDYNYIIRDIKANEVFADYFNYYLSFINDKKIINTINYRDFDIEEKNSLLKNMIIFLSIILFASLIFGIIKLLKSKKEIVQGVSKENKLKYIDMLTSLKNRNYLNDSIEKWDEVGIYPQALIIIDLNNVAYINDNYGHSEGDSVITEAANILIKNQLEQSEIMRTNGNEFLIYLVEYEEKQIITYIRKLNKEFKELAHGFGAAIGYSMINDGLKTIDDAINEATLDMRANKEEANND